MHILNLATKEITKNIDEINLKENYHFIICNPWELKFFKNTLNLSNEAYKDCLSFDEKVRVNIYDEYIFFTLSNFQITQEDVILEEINIFLSNKYILIVLRKRNDIYKEVKQLMRENFYHKSNLTLSLFIIYSNIIRIIISNQFENLDKVEEMILELEDDIINEIDNNISAKISRIRGICRSCVKNTRPLTYIMDSLLKEGMEFFSDENPSASYLEKEYQKLIQGLDLSVDKLYSFALSTRELADKLLDIYSSKVSEKTNKLITKLTIFTGTAVPISIITGIYGMNFKYMPELTYKYGYSITIFIIILIIIISFIIFKRKNYL
ncbi:MAG: CorA family divalent cation transporter [Terrisporobacter sp.]|uniref:magnesium transporter CorA family protein n=1 Tax=Terrisporobacter sp. TaxID=1965305 RepID=UPI002FC6C632